MAATFGQQNQRYQQLAQTMAGQSGMNPAGLGGAPNADPLAGLNQYAGANLGGGGGESMGASAGGAQMAPQFQIQAPTKPGMAPAAPAPAPMAPTAPAMTVGTVRDPVTGEWTMGQPAPAVGQSTAPAAALPASQPAPTMAPEFSSTPALTGIDSYSVGAESGPNGLPGITNARANLGGLPDVGERAADLGGLNAIRTGLDTTGLTDLQTDFGAQGDRVRNAMFQRVSGLVNPEHERARSATASRLANQGIPEGSERWNEEMNRLDQQRAMSLERAGLDADISSGDQQAQLFQQALAARQQGVGERATDAGIGMQARTLMGGERERAADRGFSQATTGRQLLGGERERGADRLFNQTLGTRGQLASERLTTRGQDVQDRASQRSADAQMAAANAQAGATASGHALQAAQAAAANDIARSRLGLDVDEQGFSQWLRAGTFARGGVPNQNMGTPIPLDVTGAAGVAQQGANASNAANAARNAGYWNLAGSLLGGAMGGKIKR